MGEGVAGDPPDRGVGPGLQRGPGGGCPPPTTSPRRREGRISVSPKVLVAGCHFFQQVGNVVRSARHVAGLDAACWLGGCWGPRPGLLLSLAAAPASRVAARRGPGMALRHDVRSPGRRGWGVPVPGGGGRMRDWRGRPNDGAARGATSSWVAGRAAGPRLEARHSRSRRLAPQGQRPEPASFAGRAGAADAGRCGRRGRRSPRRSRALCAGAAQRGAPVGGVRRQSPRGPPFRGNDNASRAWSRETLERRLKDGPGG